MITTAVQCIIAYCTGIVARTMQEINESYDISRVVFCVAHTLIHALGLAGVVSVEILSLKYGRP